MNRNEHTETEDLAMFALMLLPEEEALAVQEHLQTCEKCREELGRVRPDLAMYALAVGAVAPPEGARGRFLAALGRSTGGASAQTMPDAESKIPEPELKTSSTRAAAPILVRGEPHGRSRIARVLPWVGWAVAAAAGVVAIGLKADRDALRGALATQNEQTARLQADAEKARHILATLTDPTAVRVNLTVPKAPAAPTAKAAYEQKSGTLLLLASNLAPLQPQKVYELWLIPANGSKPVAAGTFSPDAHGNASLLVSSMHGAVAAKAFGITVEQAGGSVTPTLPILLAGAPG